MDNCDLLSSLKALGMSRAQLARELGIHPNTVSKWTPQTVPGYARAYLQCKRERVRDRREHDTILAKVWHEIDGAFQRARQ